MEYFDKDGHLTKEAFMTMESSCADDVLRLEFSEHVAFCDTCLEKHIACLEHSLVEMPQSVVLPVMRQVEYKQKNARRQRCVAVVVAACFALTFQFTGMFEKSIRMNEKVYQAVSQYALRIDQGGFWEKKVQNRMDTWLDFEWKGDFIHGKK